MFTIIAIVRVKCYLFLIYNNSTPWFNTKPYCWNYSRPNTHRTTHLENVWAISELKLSLLWYFLVALLLERKCWPANHKSHHSRTNRRNAWQNTHEECGDKLHRRNGSPWPSSGEIRRPKRVCVLSLPGGICYDGVCAHVLVCGR